MVKRIGFSILAAVAITGCGGGGGTIPSNQETATNTGYFVDSPVAGLEYNTSSKANGITGALGDFKFNDGDRVTFRVGKIVIGTVEPDPQKRVVTPEDIDSNKAIKIAQIIQALDSDQNASNGIIITDDIRQELQNLKEEIHLTKDDNETKILEDLNKDAPDVARHIDKDFDGKIDINKTKAKEHFEKTKEKLQNGWRPDKNRNGYENEAHKAKENNRENIYDLINNTSKATLNEELEDALKYMEEEERLAYDVYKALYNKYNDLKVFDNIATRSESRHIDITYSLLEKYDLNTTALIRVDDAGYANIVGKYDIATIQDLYDSLVAEGNNSNIDALKVGCKVEVTDVNDLNEYIKLAKDANATDIQTAFEFLRAGSYNHYWAFDKNLKNSGVENGCCSLGDEYCKDYPKDSMKDFEYGSYEGKKGSHGSGRR